MLLFRIYCLFGFVCLPMGLEYSDRNYFRLAYFHFLGKRGNISI